MSYGDPDAFGLVGIHMIPRATGVAMHEQLVALLVQGQTAKIHIGVSAREIGCHDVPSHPATRKMVQCRDLTCKREGGACSTELV